MSMEQKNDQIGDREPPRDESLPPPHQGDDYLWDKSGAPDAEIVRLERTLASLRRNDAAGSGAADGVDRAAAPAQRTTGSREVARRKHAWIGPALAMAALLGIVGFIAWPMRPWGPGTERTSEGDGLGTAIDAPEMATTTWEASKVSGAPTVGAKSLVSTQNLRINQWLYTDRFSTAKLTEPGLGTVTVEPGSKVRVTKVDDGKHWLELDKGKIQATILSPPKLFFVETRSATAVDMGCAYSLEVDEKGTGVLHVTAGWVELQREGRAVRVPRGTKCVIRAGVGPGTPIDDSASDFIIAAVERFDTGAATKSDPIADVLYSAKEEDAITLWHVLRLVPESRRAEVIDKLAAFVPLPAEVTRESVASLDDAAMEKWWDKVRYR